MEGGLFLGVETLYDVAILFYDNISLDFQCWPQFTSGHREIVRKNGELLDSLCVRCGEFVCTVDALCDGRINLDGIIIVIGIEWSGFGFFFICSFLRFSESVAHTFGQGPAAKTSLNLV